MSVAPRLRVSILVIGDEILGGYVADTNSGWLAGRLQQLGVPLDRIVTVPDERDAIAEGLLTELARARPRLVLTSGGIGSTPDDLTHEAIAAALGLPLAVHPDIDERITGALEWTARQGIEVGPVHEEAMRRMARLPQGAHLLPGALGVVPGIAVDVDGGITGDEGATIVILPGVPSELHRIMTDGIEPALLAGRGTPQHVLELTHSYPESSLNPVLQRIASEFPDVHLGSYPGPEVTVRLKGDRERTEAAMDLVRAFLTDLDSDPAAGRLREVWAARRR